MIEDDLVSDPRFEAPSDPYALYVGRHIPDKQVQSIPAAIVAARRTIPGLRAVILGDGPARSVVEEAIREAGASDFIELPGFVETEQLSDFLAGAAVLVHPSRREGYGMVVVEAAARATPAVVVLGEENAAADLVTDGVNGYRSATSKPDDLSRAIVAAVAGGRQLRQSTATWFAAAYAEGTMVTSARRVLELIERARRVPRA
jgi:glycosyltransferase involved in cell wall biosynthesis